MFRFRTISKVTLAVALCVPMAACGGKKEAADAAQLQPGEMPEGATWDGVYYSEVYGYLHLVSDGSTASGKWRTGAGDKWGSMAGTINGNVFRYEWKETTIGMVGPTATKTGHGYFRYARPPGGNVEDEIHGQWGMGAAEVGSKWDAVKQRNVKPNPSSVMPDETEDVGTGGGWDKSPGSEDSKKGDGEGSGKDGWD